MYVFEVVIALLLGGAILAALARKIGTPYPALVALAGAVLAVVPGTPTLVLDPELALALFVAPVLLDAAFDSSLRDLRANWRPIAGLALGAVALTVVTVAFVVRALVPEMPWGAAIALGAIVAPPDAAAATAVLKQLPLPNRVLVILEGESLFNDASALLIYRLAVRATVAGTVIGWNVIPTLLIVTAGSVVLGLVLARVTLLLTPRIQDVATSVIVQFCSTFAVWLLAERLQLSGILTMVIYAIAVARRAPELIPARIRVPSYAVWEVVVFVLNVLAFILIGFQLKSIIARLDQSTLFNYLWIAVLVCATAILARIVWVTVAASFSRWRCRPRPGSTHKANDAVALSPRAAALVGWCGMRGIVTLAAALALPTGNDGVPPFPYRDLILFTAFAVVLGTLVLQGVTLRPLMTRLRLEEDDTVERETRLARAETLRAALTATQGNTDRTAFVRNWYEFQLRRTEGGNSPEIWGPADADLVRTGMQAERQRLSELRAEGVIGDAAFQRVEQELDLAELGLQQLLQTERD
jgi:monovalent cation/hydrogen antiporter